MEIENLKRLADFLIDFVSSETLNFNMVTYECGTVHCAAGFGVAIGFPKLTDESWAFYVRKVFGIIVGSSGYDWCFNSRWAHVDNTPQGAAKRIYWMLKHGIPKNYHEQLYDGAPLCYREVTQ